MLCHTTWRVFDENFRVYGVCEVRRKMNREGTPVARCAVARQMKQEGLQSVVRGRPAVPSTRPEPALGNDFTYVSTRSGFVHVVFVFDALELALQERHPKSSGGFVHHSDRGGQYPSIRYTERLADAGVVPSATTRATRPAFAVGVSYDNALAETINELYEAEMILRRGLWRSLEVVESATLEWVD